MVGLLRSAIEGAEVNSNFANGSEIWVPDWTGKLKAVKYLHDGDVHAAARYQAKAFRQGFEPTVLQHFVALLSGSR